MNNKSLEVSNQGEKSLVGFFFLFYCGLFLFYLFLLALLSAKILCISGDQGRKDPTRKCLFLKIGDFLNFICTTCDKGLCSLKDRIQNLFLASLKQMDVSQKFLWKIVVLL